MLSVIFILEYILLGSVPQSEASPAVYQGHAQIQEFSSGEGGGGAGQSDKKSSDNIFFFFFF